MSAILPASPTGVTVRVPATSANLGPGFDCLSVALDMYDTMTFEKSEKFELTIEGEGQNYLSQAKDNLVYTAFESFYRHIKEPVPCVRISCKNGIPVKRGLGSSAAAVLSGLLAANTFSDKHLSEMQILNLAASLEGHADNVASALVGGCVGVLSQGDNVSYFQIPFPEALKAVAFIPDLEMSTAEGRKCLPATYPLQDVLFNTERVALLILALTTNQFDLLRIATQDRLHQPLRQKLFPQMASIFDAALSAGALGVFLSGSGSSIIALTTDKESKIGQAMVNKGAGEGIKGKMVVLHPDYRGAQVTS